MKGCKTSAWTLQRIHFARVLSALLSDSKGDPCQLIADEIRASLREDLRPGVKPHDSGYDVKSLALERLGSLQSAISKEQASQEAKSLKETLALLSDIHTAMSKRLEQLSGDRMTMGEKRQQEISSTQLRLAQ